MKNINYWSMICLVIGMMSCNENIKNNSDSESIQAEVAKAVDDLNNAIISPKDADFENIVTEELSYGHSSGKIQNKKEFIDDLVNGSFDFQEISVSDQTIDSFDQTAVVRHILSAKANNSGEPVEIKIGIFLVFQKHNGQWKLRSRQAYKL